MLLDTPAKELKFRNAIITLTELSEGNDEWYLILATMRMFIHVKDEYKAKNDAKNREREITEYLYFGKDEKLSLVKK